MAYFDPLGVETYPTLDINNCSFVNNRAFLPEVFERDQINQALNNFFEGRGGAVSIIPQDSSSNVQGKITNTTFRQNTAQLFGGSTFILISGNETSHEFVFEDCVFVENSVIRDFGGGIHVGLLQTNLVAPPTKIVLMDSRFEENQANLGGGFSVLQVSGIRVQCGGWRGDCRLASFVAEKLTTLLG